MNPHLSLIPLILIYVGFSQRRDRRRHAAAIVIALVLDVAIILYLELNRHVVDQAIHQPLSPMLRFHISLASLALIGYIVNIATGISMWRGGGGRKIHKTSGLAILVLRTLVSATAYLAVAP